MNFKSLIVVCVASVIVAGVAISDNHEGPFAKQIKARQAVFQIYSYNVGLLSAMAKGEMEYDSQTAIDAASNLNAAATMKNGTMWPQGSDNAQAEGTRALPEIWSTYPEIVEKGEALAKASTALVSVAGNGLDEMKSALGAVNKSCKGCHGDFRAKRR